MRKLLLIVIAMFFVGTAKSVPAYPGNITLKQPDGTSLTIQLHGDEYLNFRTTIDGYTVVRRDDGFYSYAQLNANGLLVSTSRVAHDPDSRSAAEKAWLLGIRKYQAPAMTATAKSEQQAERARQQNTRKSMAKEPAYDYSNFKGLILLVEYKDRKFTRKDYHDVIDNMVNEPGYSGYNNTTYGRFTGSVRDYFSDNSYGMFSPEFDVVGPVTVDVNQYYAKGAENGWRLMNKAIEAVDDQVDFSQYDRDGDGMVDMVYLIFAGLGSHMGNDERLLWPHASFFYIDQWPWMLEKDGVMLGRYACSTELYGTSQWNVLDGIGTICHEFGHVLGLPDLYDVDYSGSGGESNHPGDWSIMAGGSYLNNGRTPAGYTLYERSAIGFIEPQVIDEEGTFELSAIGDTAQGYRINTPSKNEYFLLENRQKTSKWDKYLAGHGMLVFRVEYNKNKWEDNSINNNPKHNYFELLRAKLNNSSIAKASDPFPGTGRVTTLNNVTTPANLLSWAKKPCHYGLENIKENKGIISFDVIDAYLLKSISLPEQMSIGKGLSMQLTETRVPDYAPYTLEWSTSDSTVVTVNEKGMITAVELGECDITVVANNDPELTAQCHVLVEELTPLADVAAFKAQPDETECALAFNDALVVFANNNMAFVRDASGALKLAVAGLGLETGDCLNGVIYGRLAKKNGVPQLEAVENSTNIANISVTKGCEVTPRRVHMALVTEADYSDYITLDTVTLERASGVWAVYGNKRVRLYNSFSISGISVPKDINEKYYDVTGIYTTNVLNGQVINEIEMTQPIVETAAPTAIDQQLMSSTFSEESLYDLQGRRVGRPSKGIYIQNAKKVVIK